MEVDDDHGVEYEVIGEQDNVNNMPELSVEEFLPGGRKPHMLLCFQQYEARVVGP